MMKWTILLFGALGSHTGIATAQMLTTSDVVPLIGDIFRYHGVEDDDLIDPGPTGTGVIWDHAGLQMEEGSYVQFEAIAPPTVSGLPSFPASDLVLERTISLTAYLDRIYYNVAEEGIYEVGAILDPVIYEFDIPELVQPTPMLYGTPYSGSYCYWSSGLGQTLHTCGGTQYILDGEGTLLLPYGTFENAKRTTYTRYHVVDGTPLDTSFVTFHRWWIPGVRRHVLEMARFTGTNGVTLTTVIAMDASFALGTQGMRSPVAVIHPNPFQDQVVVDLERPASRDSQVRIFTADGRLVHGQSIPRGSTRIRLDASGLPAGPLLLELLMEGLRSTHTLIHRP